METPEADAAHKDSASFSMTLRGLLISALLLGLLRQVLREAFSLRTSYFSLKPYLHLRGSTT